MCGFIYFGIGLNEMGFGLGYDGLGYEKSGFKDYNIGLGFDPIQESGRVSLKDRVGSTQPSLSFFPLDQPPLIFSLSLSRFLSLCLSLSPSPKLLGQEQELELRLPPLTTGVATNNGGGFWLCLSRLFFFLSHGLHGFPLS